MARFARLSLLAIVLIGLLAQLAVGHTSAVGSGPAPHAIAAAEAELVASPDTSDSTDSRWDLCLAILTVLSVGSILAALPLLIRMANARDLSASGRRAVAGEPRSFGLSLATVAVLRT